MKHPDSDWKDEETWNLRKDKIVYLDRDIRFNGLEDAEDHRKCFEWEYIRTRMFFGHKFEGEHVDQMFPFYLKSFPEKPYKSHAPKQRASWLDMAGENTHNWEDDLLTPFLGTNEEVDLGFYKGKLLSYKAGVTLHLNPNWSKEKFLRLVKAQSESIYGMLESEKKALELKGYVFPKKDKSRPKAYWRKRLKALGHYRLLECVNLKEQFVLEAYGKGAYLEERVYRREIVENLPDLPCSWIKA
ncbi:MAG TPA: hypothetical protein DCG39_12220 [Opitutae bacterium]|nr:hypothetical protein [Opitutae bacterium]|tara:strand:+ start:389 stop:1117 length:729 start_codon:yes stop_codon:yes gene_type:complete